MASDFVDQFKKLWSNQKVDESMGVGLMIWASGKKENIHNMNQVNKHLKWVDRNVYIAELALLNNMSGFLRSPSIGKKDDKYDFFYNDICAYYDWSRREFDLVKEILNFEYLVSIIPDHFGYDKKERKKLVTLMREINGDKEKR